jgi:hypothetical protein
MGSFKGMGLLSDFPPFRRIGFDYCLPAILLAAAALRFHQLMRAKLGAVWAAMALWIMAVDPANVFPSRLDWGPTAVSAPFPSSHSALA